MQFQHNLVNARGSKPETLSAPKNVKQHLLILPHNKIKNIKRKKSKLPDKGGEKGKHNHGKGRKIIH